MIKIEKDDIFNSCSNCGERKNPELKTIKVSLKEFNHFTAFALCPNCLFELHRKVKEEL